MPAEDHYRFTLLEQDHEYDYVDLTCFTGEALDLCTQRLKHAIASIKLLDDATFREEATTKWNVYLGVLVVDYAEAMLPLLAENKGRAIQMLSRSMYECFTKAKYFEANPAEAARQYGSIDSRMFAETLRLPHPNSDVSQELRERSAAYHAENPSRTPFDGEHKFSKMHLEVVSAEGNSSATPGLTADAKYAINYGMPSIFMHGDIVGMEDVLPHVRERGNLEYRYESGFADVLQQIGRALTYVWSFLILICDQYGLPNSDVKYIIERGRILHEMDVARRKKAGQPYMDSIGLEEEGA